MKRTRVESSMMASVGYDDAHSRLEIEFRSGHVYEYFAVPRKVYEGLREAASKGRFFHSEIEGVYPCAEIARSRARG